MRNAQAKIDTLLDVLVDRLQDEIAAAATVTDAHLAELERLIKLSNLNNQRKEKVEKVPEQGKAVEMSSEELVKALTATRDPDQFPRRGPRKGKRENVSTPAPVLCAIHEIPCAPQSVGAYPTCPSCAAEAPPPGFVTLKDLL